MKKSEEINELALALNKAQSEMGGAVTDANNPFFKSKYADLGSIIKVIKPPFANNGLSYSQFPITEESRIGVETVIMHSSGQFISNEFTMNVPKADPQSAGGVISYCRRYALQAVCGVPAVDSDAEDFMVNARVEERVEIKKGSIKQSNASDRKNYSKKEELQDAFDRKWPGSKKHTGKALGTIGQEDLPYLKAVLKNNYEVLKETDPDLLSAVEIVVTKCTENGKQDFKEAK
jgi:hypothetical protein